MEDAIQTALILAGGRGTRLRPVVADCPKVLAPVGGRPFLVYILEQLESAGLKQVILCTGYLAEQVEKTFGARFGKLRLVYSREQAPLGTGGALIKGLQYCDEAQFLALNGDSFCRFDLPSLLRFHRSRRAAGTILLTPVENAGRYGRVNRDSDGAIVRFEEKSQQSVRGLSLINAGVYLLDRRTLQGITPEQPVSLERDVFPSWVGRGLFGHRTMGPFIDIGVPESYAQARTFFAVEMAA